jgi:hypothetical protein
VFTGGCGFDATGKFYMWGLDAVLTITWPYTLKGTTGFRNIDPMYYTTFWTSVVNADRIVKPLCLKVEYQINSGTWKLLTKANLYAETITGSFTFAVRFSIAGRVVEYDGTGTTYSQFTVGETIFGKTSLATGVVEEITNLTTYGQVRLSSVSGIFVDNEILAKAAVTALLPVASPGVVTIANHNLPVGAPVVFTTAGTLPTGVTAGTTYYARNTDCATPANEFWLYTSSAYAIAGGSSGRQNFTGTSSGVHSCTFTKATVNQSTTYTDNSFPNAGTYIDALDIFTTIDPTIMYPVYMATLSFSGLVAGTEIRVYRNSDGVELGGTEACSGTTWSLDYEWPAANVEVNIAIVSLGYIDQWYTLVSLPQEGYAMVVQQQRDRQYLNP